MCMIFMTCGLKIDHLGKSKGSKKFDCTLDKTYFAEHIDLSFLLKPH